MSGNGRWRCSTVHAIWGTRRSGGPSLPQPFQMVDVEFTPEGAKEPVHALDRVDLNSIPGLRDGARLGPRLSMQPLLQ